MRGLRRIWQRRSRAPDPLDLTLDMLASPEWARRKASHPPGSDFEALSREIEQVAAYVSHLKREVGSLKPTEILYDKLPALKDDLFQATDVTRIAVDAVMSAAEAILSADRASPDFPALLDGRLTELIEACSFQDILGQRLSRVSAAIEVLERRLRRLIETVRIPDATDVFDREAIMREARRQVLLVEGPQDGGEAVEQTAIDKLFD